MRVQLYSPIKAKELRTELRNLLPNVGITKAGYSKRATIYCVKPGKKRNYEFSEKEAEILTEWLIEKGFKTCIGGAFTMEKSFLQRSQPSFIIPA